MYTANFPQTLVESHTTVLNKLLIEFGKQVIFI